jgi:hypothetical protein
VKNPYYEQVYKNSYLNLFKKIKYKNSILSIIMPNFKPKTNKKIEVCPNKITTLDSKHSEIMKKIEDDYQKEIPILLEKKKSLKNALKNINSKKQIEERLDLEDKLKEINESIK